MKVNGLNLSKTLKSNNSFIKQNRNELKNEISKELFDNCLFDINDKYYEDNNNMNNIKNGILQGIKDNNLKIEKNNYSLKNNNKSFELSKNNNNQCQNFMFQSYTNRNNFNLEKRTSFITRELKIDNNVNKNKNINKFNNPNKSMDNIPLKDKERNLFYKNLSHNKKIKIKNLVSIK